MERFTALFEQAGEYWIGYVEEVPGANTQGRTLEEARENLKEAVLLVIESNRESGPAAVGVSRGGSSADTAGSPASGIRISSVTSRTTGKARSSFFSFMV